MYALYKKDNLFLSWLILKTGKLFNVTAENLRYCLSLIYYSVRLPQAASPFVLHTSSLHGMRGTEEILDL